MDDSAFNHQPKFDGCSTNEPCLREIIFGYYHLGLGNKADAVARTVEYIDAILTRKVERCGKCDGTRLAPVPGSWFMGGPVTLPCPDCAETN